MINALWLLLIVPVSAMLGFITAAFLVANDERRVPDNDSDKTEYI